MLQSDVVKAAYLGSEGVEAALPQLADEVDQPTEATT
jgi:hypothetical protein